jgi:uncharacterized membrane protein YdfJ with MMPL/SSD domain
MLASLTLLPALLGFVGRNIDKLGLPRTSSPSSASSLTTPHTAGVLAVLRYLGS